LKLFAPGSRRSSSGQAPEQISCSANGVRSVSVSGWRSHCARQLSCPMNHPRGDACVVTGTSRSLITHSPPLTDARLGICRATNSPRLEPEHESYARVASAAHRGVVPTIEMSAHDTHTHTHTRTTRTRTRTRERARALTSACFAGCTLRHVATRWGQRSYQTLACARNVRASTRWGTGAAAQRHARKGSGRARRAPIAWNSAHRGLIAMGGRDFCAVKEKVEGEPG
jgi:hypothetical protein